MWHSLIGSGIITNDRKREIDTYVLIGSSVIFLLYNLFYIIWFLRMYKSINKFHMFSVNEAQNAAKKKHEFEMSNEVTSRVGAEASKLNSAGGGSGGGQSSGSSVYIKKSSMSNSRKSREARERERDSSPSEPIRTKNQSAINFTDLPKP